MGDERPLEAQRTKLYLLRDSQAMRKRMGKTHCRHGRIGLCAKSGVQCYQNGLKIHKPNMSLENFKKIANECKGKTFQFALGGRGDPDQHENFKEILTCSRNCNIVPNFTSSGLGFTNEIIGLCKDYCGAVAISWYRQEHTYKAIQMLVNAGVKTNIHYVLGNNSIDEAIDRLKNNNFPEGINAIVFLAHKNVGLGTETNILKYNDPKVQEFFNIIDTMNFNFNICFDSCSIQGGRWSMYITSDMIALPCSFDNQEMRWAYNLNGKTIQDAWNSKQFEDFRNHFRNSCMNCKDRLSCMGGCPIRPEIVICNRKEKKNENSQ